MPFPVLLALAAITALKAGKSYAAGASQSKQARELERENPRPVDTVPQGVLDATSQARLMASIGMPAEQYNKAIQQIERTGTAAAAAARDRRSGVDAVSTIQQAENDATVSLDSNSAVMRQQNQMNLINQLNNLGQWQDKIWSYNSMLKYQENAAAIRALKTSSKANKNAALDSVLSFATTAIGGIGSKGGGKGTTESVTGGIDTSALSGGVEANKGTLQAGKPDSVASPSDIPAEQRVKPLAYEDPTLTNPEMFSDGKPNVYMDYLLKLKQMQTAA